MERLDAIVAGIGVLVVAVALGGVVATGPVGEGTFRVAFLEQRVPLEAQRASFAGDGQAEVPVPVEVANLTRLTFTVRVGGAGPRAAPDTVEVTLDGPDGRSETQQASLPPGGAADATLTFERTVRALPAAQQVRAASAEAAVAAADPGAGGANGTGAWTFTVSAATGGLPQLHQEAHNVLVETVAFAFRGSVQPEVVNPR